MASGSYLQVHVQCPFYRTDDGRSKIVCEGFLDQSTVSLNFQHKDDMRQQMELFCCSDYKNCEIYRMIMDAKY